MKNCLFYSKPKLKCSLWREGHDLLWVASLVKSCHCYRKSKSDGRQCIRRQMNMRRLRGLLPGTHDQMFIMSLPRKLRALYDRILLPLSNFVVRRCFFFSCSFPSIQLVFEFLVNTPSCESSVTLVTVAAESARSRECRQSRLRLFDIIMSHTC